ncbi:MAG: type II secretion system protein, partial [Okeania sp. SIO2D1]|nr:type II secretion system protein [Okeania sp. SIO2D1]
MNKQLQKLQTNINAGYTIMEGLVAMIMVAFLMSAVAPVIALSVGTRVQARRVELATQAARSYIDGLRAGSIPAPAGTSIGGGETSFGVSTFD